MRGLAITSGMGNTPRVPEGDSSGQPETDFGSGSLNLHELIAHLIEAQRARVFKALEEEGLSGKGLDRATSVEMKRLASMIVVSSQLGRPAPPQNRAGESPRGPVSTLLAVLNEKPRKKKR